MTPKTTHDLIDDQVRTKPLTDGIKDSLRNAYEVAAFLVNINAITVEVNMLLT